jgi:hypothetical protein
MYHAIDVLRSVPLSTEQSEDIARRLKHVPHKYSSKFFDSIEQAGA